MKTYEDVVRILSAIEPTESMFDPIGIDDLPHLERLRQHEEPWLAARAVHAASRLKGLGAANIVRAAARDSRHELRVAAAVAAPKLQQSVADEVVLSLLDDEHAGVRKYTIRAVNPSSSLAVKEKLRSRANDENNDQLKRLAVEHAQLVR